MDIFEYAMEFEKDTENYYRDLAERVQNKGLKTILGRLAEEEVKHYKTFSEMKSGINTQMRDTQILDNAKSVFAQMKVSGPDFAGDISQPELYRKAQQLEEKSRDFYIEKAGQIDNPLQKDIFLRIADEEKKHYFLLEKIINFVLQPQRWLENAEFYQLEEY